MNRVRRPNDPNDGGAYLPANRPPLDVLPPNLAKALGEYDSVRGRLEQARSRLGDLTYNWNRLIEEAREADGLAAGQAARAGKATASTENVDKLHTERTQVEGDVEALTVAIRLIESDLVNLREEGKTTTADLEKTETARRKELTKALDQALNAATALTATVALREWYLDHLPYDPSVNLPVGGLWPGISNYGDTPALTAPVSLSHILTQLETI